MVAICGEVLYMLEAVNVCLPQAELSAMCCVWRVCVHITWYLEISEAFVRWLIEMRAAARMQIIYFWVTIFLLERNDVHIPIFFGYTLIDINRVDKTNGGAVPV